MKYYVYILRAADGFLYTGTTRDLAARVKRHNQGRGGRFTRGRKPLTLVYHERFTTLGSAMAREARIKRLPRAKKLALIDDFLIR